MGQGVARRSESFLQRVAGAVLRFEEPPQGVSLLEPVGDSGLVVGESAGYALQTARERSVGPAHQVLGSESFGEWVEILLRDLVYRSEGRLPLLTMNVVVLPLINGIVT